MVNKKEFFQYMSDLYSEEYKDNEGYKTLKKILKITDLDKILELEEITEFNKDQRLVYRENLANNGKELTPFQVDQYISIIDYALSHMDI